MLRTRRVPAEIQELLSIVNKLPRSLEASHYHVLLSPTLKLGVSAGESAPIEPTTSPSIDESTLRRFLQQAIEELPTELRVFVQPPKTMLDRKAEDWRRALGPLLFDCALGASGGLFPCEGWTSGELETREALEAGGQISFPHKGKPYFGFGEVEATRQRYLFLFALREVFEAASVAHVSLDDARRRLNQLDSQLASFRSSRPAGEVEAFRGRFDIGAKHTKKKTHNLGYAKPQIAWVLEKIELERIRQCPVCEKLFWAGRLDQSACRTRCSNVLRAQTWREKYSAKYKTKRRGPSKTKVKTKKG